MIPLVHIGPPGSDPAAVTRAVTLYRAGQHAQKLAHRDRLRSAVAKQPVRPSATLPATPVKKSRGKKSASENMVGRVHNAEGVNGGSVGRPGDPAHGTDPANIRQTNRNMGGMAVRST